MAKEKAQWAVGFEGAGRHLTHITLVREELATTYRGDPPVTATLSKLQRPIKTSAMSFLQVASYRAYAPPHPKESEQT